MLVVHASGCNPTHPGSYYNFLVCYNYEEAKTCIDYPFPQCLPSDVCTAESCVEPH